MTDVIDCNQARLCASAMAVSVASSVALSWLLYKYQVVLYLHAATRREIIQ